MTSKALTLGHTIIRVGIGSALFAHGAQKLFGLFGGGGLEGTGQFFESIGISPGKRTALIAGLGEAGGGVALALGLGTPAGAAAAAATMTVAASQHTSNGFFNADGGFELPATLGLTAATFLISGPGAVSLDRVLGDVLNRPWMRVLAFVVVVPAAAIVIHRQRSAQAATASEAADASE